jgi:poly(A) polymerase
MNERHDRRGRASAPGSTSSPTRRTLPPDGPLLFDEPPPLRPAPTARSVDVRPHEVAPRREPERPRRERERERERERDREPRRDPPPALPLVDNRFAVGPRPRVVPRQFPIEHLDEDALKVIRRLTRAGHLGYLVGGSVRDLLLGRKPKDFDVATSARPHEVKEIFRNCRIIGRRFRLAHILFGSRKVIETATFRRDPGAELEGAEADGADASGAEAVESEPEAFTPLTPRAKPRDEAADLLIRHDNVFGDPHEDALRRDFTINGLFYDIERGEVIDYVGGLSDVEARVVRTIGVPDVRFREDPVRILRAIKFAARCDLGIDPEVYDAMVAQQGELTKAARPRLFEEILRLLRGGAAHRSFWLAWETGVLAVVLPELASFLDDETAETRWVWGRLRAVDARIAAGEVPSDAVLLTALLQGVIDDALEGADHPPSAYEDLMTSITERLAVPRRMKDRIRILVGAQPRLRSGRHAALARREFFAEAFDVHAIDCSARELPVPQPAPAAGAPPAPAEGPHDAVDELPRRRRRRRRARAPQRARTFTVCPTVSRMRRSSS